MNIYFQDIMERIRMHYKKMTNTERIIADFFLSNTEKMEFSAKAVAARLHVSEPAMTRFSKKIGFSGYREFQYLYEINFQTVQCDDEELLHRIIDTYQKILLHFDGGITKQVYRFCESLSEASRVYIFALGSSACAAREFKLRFMRLGLLVEIIDNPHLMQMQAVLTKPEDLVIGMSISGETEAVLDALRTAGLHHTETVLITACRKQHFQEQFGQILTVPAVEGLSLGDNISPQLPFLIITDVIYSLFMGMDSKYRTALFQDTLTAIGKKESGRRGTEDEVC